MTMLVHIAVYCLAISIPPLHRHPAFLIMEGTTKADYGDKLYHVKAGLKGLVIGAIGSIAVGSLVFAAKLAISALAR